MKNSKRIKLLDYERTDWIFIGFILLLGLLLLGPGLRPGRIMLPFPDTRYHETPAGYQLTDARAYAVGSDANLEFQPWNDYACERLKNGKIPFWNPYNLCGAPFFANSLNQMTYIPRIILSFILPSENVITALALMHFLLCAIGFYYFLKAFKVIPIAAGLAAFLLIFKFSHPTVMMMPPQALTLAYMPVCLLLTIKLLRGAGWLWTLLLAVCLSCAISSGYPIFFVHFFYVGLGLVLWEYFVVKEKDGGVNRTGMYKILVALGLAVMFSLTQLLPFIRLLSLSAFPPITKQMLMHFHFSIGHILLVILGNIASPFAFIDQLDTGDFSNLYLGIIPIFIALPIFGQWRNKTYRFFIIVAGLAAILCFSTTAFHAAMKLIPGFGISPVPPFPVLFFCLITAFGLTLNHILKPEYRITNKWFVIIMPGLIILMMITLVYYLRSSSDPHSAALGFFIIHLGLVVIGLFFLWLAGGRKLLLYILCFTLFFNLAPLMIMTTNFYGPSDSLALECKGLRAEGPSPLDSPRFFNATEHGYMAANINIYPRIRLVQGYDSLILKQIVDYYERNLPNSVRRGRRVVSSDPGNALLLRESGVSKVILNPDSATDGNYEEISGLNLYITDEPYSEFSISKGNAEMHRISPEKFAFTVDVSDTAELRIAETYFPAWRYRVDDESKTHPVRMDENGFMLIPDIPAMADSIKIIYDPKLEKLGLILTIISFILGVTAISYLDRKAGAERG